MSTIIWIGLIVLLSILAFIAGIFFFYMSTIYGLMKKPGQCLYWDFGEKKLKYVSMLKPLPGLRDMHNELIKPGFTMVMMPDQSLLIVSRVGAKEE